MERLVWLAVAAGWIGVAIRIAILRSRRKPDIRLLAALETMSAFPRPRSSPDLSSELVRGGGELATGSLAQHEQPRHDAAGQVAARE